MKKYYLHIAIVICGLAFFYAGYTVSEIYTISEIKAVEDWQRGYEYGVFKTRFDVWKKYGITDFSEKPLIEEKSIEEPEEIVEEDEEMDEIYIWDQNNI